MTAQPVDNSITQLSRARAGVLVLAWPWLTLTLGGSLLKDSKFPQKAACWGRPRESGWDVKSGKESMYKKKGERGLFKNKATLMGRALHPTPGKYLEAKGRTRAVPGRADDKRWQSNRD